MRFLPRRRLGWLSVAFTAGTFLNALRLRRRLSGLAVLPATVGAGSGPADSSGESDFVRVHLSGVEITDTTWWSAMAYAEAEGLDVLDLVPGTLPPDQALDLARRVDSTTFRSAPFAAGAGALHAVLVRRDVWDRSRRPGDGFRDADGAVNVIQDRASFARLMVGLKKHAARSSDMLASSDLNAVEAGPDERLAELEVVYEAFPAAMFARPAVRSSIMVVGLALSPGWGALTIVATVLEARIVTGGSPVGLSGRSLRSALRSFVELVALIRSRMAKRAGRGVGTVALDPVESRRPVYTELMAHGLDPFFEPPTTTCPLCSSTELAHRLCMPDRITLKPGQFTLDICRRCGHIFQNPRLSLAGLDFYYRDAYDGLGGVVIESAFAHAESSYRGRVEMVRRHVTPTSWLDVGSGYGHFCLLAKGSLPDTRFDGLDMGVSIDEAERRRWVDHAYRGLFPDLAGQLPCTYDVVSMHHYLEHTRDPWAELDVVNHVLRPGGLLLIEVPDPESHFARLLGGMWMPWLQPQHQHFLSVGNLRAALTDRGFTVVEVERGPAHQSGDFTAALLMAANSMASHPRLPWLDPPTAAGKLGRAAVVVAVAPLFASAQVADQVLRPLIRTKAPVWSNAYRILVQSRS